MDNETYLKHIAAQARPAPTSSRLLSPMIIKLIAGAVIALILIIVLGSILNSANQKTVGMYERFYLRLQNLSSESGPLVTYGRDLKSSDLRLLASNLKVSLTDTARSLTGVLTELRVDTAKISADATSSESAVLGAFVGELQNAKLNGLLDRTFASSTTLQISLLLSMQSEMREKTSNTTLAGILDKSTRDLEALHEQFKNYSNSN